MRAQTTGRFTRFADFYPFYLEEHRNPTCRRLHFAGSVLVLALLVAALVTGQWLLLLAMPVVGYGFAWVGHFAFEKNRPATFQYPLYSLLGDWVMFRDMLIGRIRF
ncbi:DUF962 domain-containing protein [Stutzerimonas urumqiensis]|uniref:Mpo1-like protein n=1 Tax=Stutzerimonas urumqiensis TaxID=638269 RepID=UPI003BA88041